MMLLLAKITREGGHCSGILLLQHVYTVYGQNLLNERTDDCQCNKTLHHNNTLHRPSVSKFSNSVHNFHFFLSNLCHFYTWLPFLCLLSSCSKSVFIICITPPFSCSLGFPGTVTARPLLCFFGSLDLMNLFCAVHPVLFTTPSLLSLVCWDAPTPPRVLPL